MKRSIFLFTFILMVVSCHKKETAKNEFAFQDSSLSVEERVKDLISRMTLEEKLQQMRYEAPAIERLGVPAYNWWNECLHGVGRAGTATVFPQAIGMSAAWDDAMMHNIATAISDEARAKHQEFVNQGRREIYMGLTFWTPNINIFRDPRWGRGQETYGEDPYLTSRLAVNFIKGLQGDDPRYLKLVATAKHFAVHSGPESTRHSINAQASDRDLRETYLPAFEASVKEANVASIMCAYNRFRGEVCCGSDLLLNDILHKEWGFNGYVVSDCWAVEDFHVAERHGVVKTPEEAAAMAVKAKTFLECGNTYKSLGEALKQGLVTEQEIDEAIFKLFEYRFKLGMFDDQEKLPWAKLDASVVNNKDHQELSLKVSRESIVLLKNENNILPLSKQIKSIAVIGPNANDYQVMLGNYHGTPINLVTPLQGIKNKLGNGVQVNYAEGCEIAKGVPSLKPIPSSALVPAQGSGKGLYAEYYGNMFFKGDPEKKGIDSVVNFIWRDKTPINNVLADSFSVRWTGKLVAPVSGKYKLGVNACNGVSFFLNDSLHIKFENPHHPSQQTVDIDLEKGETYNIRMEHYSYGADPQAHLIWAVPGQDLLTPALEAAKKSDVVVLFMGLSPHLEGEEMPIKVEGFIGGDRTDIGLPATQVELLKKIKATGKPMVLVLLGGSAIAVNWADQNIPAILEAWYPGESGGTAIADVLFGDYNPAGRLPVTFYKSVKDLPDFEDYSMKNRTYKYFKGEPLYPFGFGLSYTTFSYGNLSVPQTVTPDQSVKVAIDVTNSGKIDGDEVIQLYVKDIKAKGEVANRSLQGFKRVHLKAGETKKIEFELSPKQFASITNEGKFIVEPGKMEICVGGKQPGFKGNADAKTTAVLTAVFEVHGQATEVK